MRKIVSVLLSFALFCSCNIIRDDDVVARVGKNKLYKSELDKYIPELVSPEDSANLAMQYINTWASELLYEKVASEQLSKSEMDVSAELEDYRRSLLKYRYEQRYINDRLDTLITEGQIAEYYEKNKSNFELDRPIVKFRYVDIMKGAPNKDLILKKMCSSDFDEVQSVSNLAHTTALRYWDCSEKWMDSILLAKEFGIDYESMFKLVRNNLIRVESNDRPDLQAAYISEVQYSGPAPVEYCADKIRNYILSARKHKILADLEQDLLKNALSQKQLVIY